MIAIKLAAALNSIPRPEGDKMEPALIPLIIRGDIRSHNGTYEAAHHDSARDLKARALNAAVFRATVSLRTNRPCRVGERLTGCQAVDAFGNRVSSKKTWG